MKYRATITLTEEMLGTVPKDPAVYKEFIASKMAKAGASLIPTLISGVGVNAGGYDPAKAAEEIATVPIPVDEEKGWTGFHTDPDGRIFVYDYLIKGHLKAACEAMKQVKDSHSEKFTNYKHWIDRLVFIFPRKIYLTLSADATIGVLERPLRAMTMQGPRVTVVRSDTVPVGTTFTFEIHLLGEKVTEAHLREWLDYGQLYGYGQWRSGGFGRMTYTLEKTG